MKLSIITGTHDRSAMLLECAQSVMAQTVGDFEWVIAADGPTPEVESTLERILRGARHDIAVKVIGYRTTTEQRRATYRPAELTNELFSSAKGDRVVWLSDDDLIKPRFVERMAATDAPAVYCSVERRLLTALGGWHTYTINWAVDPWQYGISDGGAMVLRKDAWDSMDWRLPTDWATAPDLDQRFMAEVNRRWPLKAVQDVLLVHRDTKEAAHQSWRKHLWL